ncbi:MAG: DUF5655 domain-containing protein [Planctomycetota bacterium]
MATQTRKKSIYGVHPGVAIVQDWIEALQGKTGRSLEQWIALVKKEGPKDEAGRRAWLKKEHELGTNSAWWIAERAAGRGMEDGDPATYLKAAERYVEEQYAGKKDALRPIYERLLKLGLSVGKDVKACPCQTIVPLYRAHVFAQIKPSTNTRVDLGLALKDTKTPARLVDTGGFAKKDRITRRIAIASVAEIDAEVERWLRKAYEMDG